MSNRNALALNESYPQHVVTAVIVAHDGVSWLPQVADAVLEQTRPVQRVVAVDTGSRDRSGAVLAAKFGQSAVFGMDRGTGYGAAVARALTHPAANLPVPGVSGVAPADRVEWIWLLHDDCEPAPDALEQLLRGAAEAANAAVLGPKIRDWTSRDIVLEAGVTLDSAARRVTGIEPREVDQGQHDGDRDAVAVSSAGMLIRRDVWDQVGGFDTGMSLFMDDIDFCWRVHSAGYRVRVITDAVVYHVRAAAKHRRPISVGRRAQMLDRRNGLITLLGNLPFGRMLASTLGNLMVSLLRVSFFLLAKRLMAALDESAAVVAVLAHPLRMFRVRRRRAPGRRAAYSRLRGDLPSGHSPRRLLEFASSVLLKSGQVDTAGSHHASIDPDEDDSLLVDNGLARRILTSPGVLTFVVLLVVALVASRSLLGAGPLGGGSLVPTWGGASDLWRVYLQAFHPTGIGSAAAAPAYLAVVGALATLLFGKAWLAIDVILIGSVPLAGLTAMIAASRVTASVAVRIWVAVTYALLPVAMGVIAAGRFGTAVVFILLPLIALSLVRVFTAAGRRAGRAAWAAGLLVAIGAAFVPLLWLLAVAGCLLGAIAVRAAHAALLRSLAVVVLAAPVLLFPWTMTLAARPSQLLTEAGLPQPGAVAGVRLLLLLNPGGPGMPPYWVTGGLIAVAFAALFVGRRRKLVLVGWGVALSGMLAAILVSHLVVRPGDGGAVIVWAGLPVAVAALGLLLAAAVGADGLGRMLAGRKGWHAIASGRGAWVVVLALLGCSAPVLAAGFWVARGVTGPVHPVAGQVVPELVAVADGQRHQVRTLVLRSDHGQVSYLLMRGPSPTLADTALVAPATAQRALRDTVAALTSPVGGSAVNLSRQLANFDIGYVLVRAPVDPGLVGVLNDVSGLRPYSTTGGYSLWQLDSSPARVTVLEPNGTVVPIPSGPVGLAGVPAPPSGGVLMLSEPVSAGWHASLNGRALARVPSPAGSWAQAFRLPPGGGTLAVGYSGFWHDLALAAELVVFLIALGLALPGIRVAELDAQPAGEIRLVGGRQSEGRHGTSRADDATGMAQVGSSGDEGPETVLSGVGRPGSARSGAARSGSAGAGRAAAGSGAADTGDLPGADQEAEGILVTGAAVAGRHTGAAGSGRGGARKGLRGVGRGKQDRPARGRGRRPGHVRGADGEADHEQRTRPTGSQTGETGTAGVRASGHREMTGRPDAAAPLARAWPYADESESADGPWGTRTPRSAVADRDAAGPDRGYASPGSGSRGGPSGGPNVRDAGPAAGDPGWDQDGSSGRGSGWGEGPAGRGPAGSGPRPSQRNADGWPYQDSGESRDRAGDRARGPGGWGDPAGWDVPARSATPAALPSRSAEPRSPAGTWSAAGRWDYPYGSGQGYGAPGYSGGGHGEDYGSQGYGSQGRGAAPGRGAAGREPGPRRQAPSAGGWNLEDSGELEPLPPDGGVGGGPDGRAGRASAWRPSRQVAGSGDEPADMGEYPPSGRDGTSRRRSFRGRGEQRQAAGPVDGWARLRRPGGAGGERSEPESGQAEREYEGESW